MQSDLLNHEHTTLSDTATHLLGVSLGRELPPNSIVAFFGDLGAGKTTFIRGLVEGIGSSDPRIVSSPTFNFLNIYQGKKAVYHFDLYRLPRMEEFFEAGFDEHFTAGGICCIEWAEKIQSALPADTITVTLSYTGAESRKIHIVRGQK